MPSLSLIIAVPPFLISNILGGRPDWYVYSMRNWSIWSYFISYFPIKLIKTADIPPNKVDFCQILPLIVYCIAFDVDPGSSQYANIENI